MKVGLVCPYDLSRDGGVQEIVRYLAQELEARHHEVRLITPRPRGYSGSPPANTIFVGSSTKWNTPISTTLEIGASFDTSQLDEILVQEQFDVLNVHEPEVPFLGAQIVGRASCPVVATFHAMMPDTAMARTIEAFRIPYSRSIFRNIQALTAVSEPAAMFVREWSGRDIQLIPNCIDVKSFRPKSPDTHDEHTIFFVGRLEKRKGVKYLLQAFAELAQKYEEPRLVIAGDGPEREKLEEWVHEHHLGKRVEFLGYISVPEKRKRMQEAAVFCAPAPYGESFGIVLLEAMAAGLPIVAGDNPGYVSVLQGSGLLSIINPKDSSDFARRLEMFLQDQGLRKLWLDWADEYIKQFDYPTVVGRYLKVFQQAVREKPVKL